MISDDLAAIWTCTCSSSLHLPSSLLKSCIIEDMSKWVDEHKIFNTNNNEFVQNREYIAVGFWLKRSALQMLKVKSIYGMQVAQMQQPLRPDLVDEELLAVMLHGTIRLLLHLRSLPKGIVTSEDRELNTPLQTHVLIQSISKCIIESFEYIIFAMERLQESHKIDRFISKITKTSNLQNLCMDLTQIASDTSNILLASNILDFVCLLSTFQHLCIKDTSLVHWNLFCRINQENCSDKSGTLPYSFALLLEKDCRRTSRSPMNSSQRNKDSVLVNLTNSVLNVSSANPIDFYIACHLCAHWAHSILNVSRFCDRHRQLLTCLENAVQDDKIAVRCLESKEQLEVERNKASIQSISTHTTPIVCEVMLNLCVKSYAMDICDDRFDSKSGEENSHKLGNDMSKETGNEILLIFGAILDLIISKLYLFAGKTLNVSIQACLAMVKLFETQIEQTFTLRSISILNTPRKVTTDKFFALKQEMFECVQTHTKKVIELCHVVPTFEKEINAASFTNRKVIIALEARCEGILNSLDQINGPHNYFLPSSLECLGGDHEIEKVESKNNYGQIFLRDSSANTEESPIKLRKLCNERSAKNDLLLIIKEEGAKRIENDEDDSGSFGVVGDWDAIM